MFKVERYHIDDQFKVHGIVSNENPNGDGIYNPYEVKEVLPFWGTLVTTFWGLSEANRTFLINNISKEELEELQFKKFWIFWFCNGDIDSQTELFFYGPSAKENAYSVLQVFNHLHEIQIDRLIEKTKQEYKLSKEL
jgi:hypothetical protein